MFLIIERVIWNLNHYKSNGLIIKNGIRTIKMGFSKFVNPILKSTVYTNHNILAFSKSSSKWKKKKIVKKPKTYIISHKHKQCLNVHLFSIYMGGDWCVPTFSGIFSKQRQLLDITNFWCLKFPFFQNGPSSNNFLK